MNQRQLRLGDVLDDYCPRERRLTNHAVVAMVGDEVKQTRCTTCEAEHQYRRAKVPRPRKTGDVAPALVGGSPVVLPKKPSAPAVQSGANPPHDNLRDQSLEASGPESSASVDERGDNGAAWLAVSDSDGAAGEGADDGGVAGVDQAAGQADETDAGVSGAPDGPAHRRLIRATLPRIEGQPPQVQRQAPDFTIRQPSGGRPARFRPRPGGGPDQPQGRSQGFDRHASGHGGPPRHGERQHAGQRPAKHQGFNRKRSK